MPKLSKNRHRREYHRNSEDPDRRVHKDASRAKAHPKPPPAKLPKESLSIDLREDDHYVRRWLEQTETNTDQDDALVTGEALFKKEAKRAAQAEVPPVRAPLESAHGSGPSKRRKGHDSSSDSSVLEVQVKSMSHQSTRDETQHVILNQSKMYSPPPRKKQRVASSESGLPSHSSTPNHPKETFEKRPRHKTREDIYEPKKKNKKRKRASGERSSRKKRERRGGSKNAANTAGDELIQNFRSKNISQDRLTIRPSNGLGLFNNGRASSPARRRGLPDLAFSEMEFLQHSRARPQSDKENMVKSRSREKEREKSSRMQDEISTFFRPTRAHLQAVSPNCSGAAQDVFRKEPNLYSKRLDPEGDRDKYRDSEPLDLRSEPSRDFEVAGPFFEKYQVSHDYNASQRVDHSTNPPDSSSRVSGKATTYVSWSESQRSPVSTSRHGSFDQRNISLTPDSVRRSIEKTRIFRGTGIENTLTVDLNQTNGSPEICERHNLRPDEDVQRDKSTDQLSTESNSSSKVRNDTTNELQQDRVMGLPEFPMRKTQATLPERQERTGKALSTDQTEQIDIIDQRGPSRKRVVIEYFDPTLGWREGACAGEHSQRTGAGGQRLNDSQVSKAKPLTRDEIAKKARVKVPKRSSTTVPLLRETSNEKQLPVENQTNRRMPFLKTDSGRLLNEDMHQVTSLRVVVNSNQRPLLSRVSNPSLPTIYEDSDEQSLGHGEAPLLENQVASPIVSQTSQSRLNIELNNNPTHFESQFQQQGESSYHAEQDASQEDDVSSRNVTYLGLPTTGGWLGTSLSSTTFGNASLPPLAGAQSLYVRQMQRQSNFYHVEYDGSNNAIGEVSWKSSSPASPAYNARVTYENQQHGHDLAETAYCIDHGNSREMYQAYEQGLSNANEEYYDELGNSNAESNGANQGFHEMGGQSHGCHESEQTTSEHFPIPHPESSHGYQHDEYKLRADIHQSGFWQPHHFW
ncbi:hypothetical protein ONS96_012092 [Cadophora gregata f. sp. sojae]|nr:hypothetical protein ONS96_012092 [Cadophora gregata f. sp. sojae]